MGFPTGQQLSVIFNSWAELTAGFICLPGPRKSPSSDYRHQMSVTLQNSGQHAELHNFPQPWERCELLAARPTSGCLQSCWCQRELKHDKKFQNNQGDNRSLRLCERSADVYANALPQSTSWWLLCMCLVLVTAIIVRRGDSFLICCFT